jgi:hypothetical protein
MENAICFYWFYTIVQNLGKALYEAIFQALRYSDIALQMKGKHFELDHQHHLY